MKTPDKVFVILTVAPGGLRYKVQSAKFGINQWESTWAWDISLRSGLFFHTIIDTISAEPKKFTFLIICSIFQTLNEVTN